MLFNCSECLTLQLHLQPVHWDMHLFLGPAIISEPIFPYNAL